MSINELLFDLITQGIREQEVWTTDSVDPEHANMLFIEGWVDIRAVADRIAENVIADLANRVPATKEN